MCPPSKIMGFEISGPTPWKRALFPDCSPTPFPSKRKERDDGETGISKQKLQLHVVQELGQASCVCMCVHQDFASPSCLEADCVCIRNSHSLTGAVTNRFVWCYLSIRHVWSRGLNRELKRESWKRWRSFKGSKGRRVWRVRRGDGVWAAGYWAARFWENHVLQWHVPIPQTHWQVRIHIVFPILCVSLCEVVTDRLPKPSELLCTSLSIQQLSGFPCTFLWVKKLTLASSQIMGSCLHLWFFCFQLLLLLLHSVGFRGLVRIFCMKVYHWCNYRALSSGIAGFGHIDLSISRSMRKLFSMSRSGEITAKLFLNLPVPASFEMPASINSGWTLKILDHLVSVAWQKDRCNKSGPRKWPPSVRVCCEYWRPCQARGCDVWVWTRT